MASTLITDQVGNRKADGAIEFSDDHFGFGRGIGGGRFDDASPVRSTIFWLTRDDAPLATFFFAAFFFGIKSILNAVLEKRIVVIVHGIDVRKECGQVQSFPIRSFPA